MRIISIFPLSLCATAATIVNEARESASSTIWVTPHDSYSSSVGVLGCKIDTNRVAYWPSPVSCDDICVSVEYAGRQVYLLRVDQSGGAHDVSYDAWNYLYTGHSATDDPTAGGAVKMTYSPVEASKCRHLIMTKGGALPLSAANSMNYLSECLRQPDSWVAGNYALYNILDPVCSLGYDEKCTLDWPAQNQATCKDIMGGNNVLTDSPVYNIQYPSGKKVLASSVGAAAGGSIEEDNAASSLSRPLSRFGVVLSGSLIGVASVFLMYVS